MEVFLKYTSVYQFAWGFIWQLQSNTLFLLRSTKIIFTFDLSKLNKILNPFIKNIKIVQSKQGNLEVNNNFNEILSKVKIKYKVVNILNNNKI